MNYGTKAEMALLLDFYGSLLTERQREIADLSTNEDLSLREIASVCGITYQGVRESLKKSESILKDAEAKLGLIERFDGMRERFAFIVDSLNDLKKNCPDFESEIDRVIDAAKEMLDSF